MRPIRKTFADLAISGLLALALGGLIFPTHLLAQSHRGLDLTGPAVATSYRVDVLERADDSELPRRFVVTGGGLDLLFELDGDGYRWRDRSQEGVFGRETLPDLGQALRWQASTKPSGELRASIPLAELGGSNPETGTPALGTGFDFERQLARPTAELFGAYDPQARAYALSVEMPNQQRLDFTVTFAHLASEAIHGGGAGGALLGKTVIHIPWSLLLAILGRVICGAITSLCFYACNLVCTSGVDYVQTAACGIGCTCVCN